jgi:DNA/RNA-binding domain of Phe-tRNA-synthetase-like protein
MYQVRNHSNGNSRELKVEFSEDVFSIAPELYVGLIATPKVNNMNKDAKVDALLTHMEQEIMNSGLQRESISELPTIAAWRRIYSQFGVKPARYPCAAESLIRRVIEQGSLARINTLVDLCNAISLKCCIPIASCDIGDVQELVIRRAEGNERYLPIGKVDEYENPVRGEIIYADNLERAHSRRWNWRQSDCIKTTSESSQMLFTIEAVHKEAKVLVEATTFLLQELLQPFTEEETCEIAFIHEDYPKHTFQLHSGGVFTDHDEYNVASEKRIH